MGITTMRLMKPFWRSIAIIVVKELQNRPQIAQQLSDLLGITVAEFLILTKTSTLPYLILTNRQDVLRRVAQAHGSEVSIWDICVERVNMAVILAYLLLQPSTDPESMIAALLRQASSEFENTNLADLVRAEPILIAFELLKAAAEDDEIRKPKVRQRVKTATDANSSKQTHQAIHLLAMLAHRKSGHTKGSIRKNSFIGPFFETYVLGIMDQMSNVVNDVRMLQPCAEKKRCLGAIREMIMIAKSHVSNALPQVSPVKAVYSSSRL